MIKESHVMGQFPPARLMTWPKLAGYGAAIWSLCYAGLNLYWILGGEGYPYQDVGRSVVAPLITDTPAIIAGPILGSICLLAAVIALATMQKWGEKLPRAIGITYAWGMCVGLILLASGAGLLAHFGYAFALKFIFSWVVTNQLNCMAGAFLWGLTALAYQRKTRAACLYCGRTEEGQPIRSNKWIAYVAAVLALPYGISRFLWGLGIPFLIDPAVVGDHGDDRSHILLFGILFFIGAILTLGLAQRWGEVFPRWMLGLAGKRVPPMLAIVPSTIVTIMLIQGGIGFYQALFFGDFLKSFSANSWGEWAPGLFWLPWGVMLGAATIAYYHRRRGQCQHCGLGEGKQ